MEVVAISVESPPWALNAGTYTAEQTRRAVFSWASRTSANNPGIVSGGLYSASDCQATAPGSGLSVNISTGEILIPGNEGGAQGPGYARVSSTTNVTIATANASNPRIDIVCATMSDAQYTEPTGGSGSQWALQAITGTPTVGATLANLSGAPTLPGSSLLIAYVLVPAAAANIITADIANVAVPYDPWIVYTPAWTCASVAPVVGNATLTGAYLTKGSTCFVRVYLSIPSSWTGSGGQGATQFGLPFAAASGFEQDLFCKLFAAINSTSWCGPAVIPASSATCSPFMPNSATNCAMANFQNAAAGNAAGSGIPIITSNYAFTTGSNFVLTGHYQIS